jgi:alpha-L-arabinofuranosidase
MSNQMIINAKREKGQINRNIYGHFAEHLGRCIYEGIWVGEKSDIPNVKGIRTDVVEALKKLKIPVLRWPGGCFADEYHWRDGIGLKEQRKEMINSHWGGVVENNHFGTHEFLELCEMLETEPYICGNLGSGTVQEMSEWVEYINFEGKSPMTDLRKQNGREKPWNVKYWGVGNENWNCGGRMRAERYADEYNRYNLYCRNYGNNKLFRVAAGPRGDHYHWTEVMMREAGRFMDGLGLHYYTRLGDPVILCRKCDGNIDYLRDESRSRKSATDFDEAEWFGIMKSALRTEELIIRHSQIMDHYDPDKRVALIIDEWGTWFDCEPGTNPGFLYQQNTLRDALSCGTSLNIFNNHCDRVKMANLAQTINVLQAVILTNKEKMILTPTYHVFDMYKVHQDAMLLDYALLSDDYRYGDESLKQVNATVSKNAAGQINMTLCNIDANNAANLVCHIADSDHISSIMGTILTSDDMHSKNTFDEPDKLRPESFNQFKLQDFKLSIDMPAKSVVLMTITLC